KDLHPQVLTIAPGNPLSPSRSLTVQRYPRPAVQRSTRWPLERVEPWGRCCQMALSGVPSLPKPR
ncbi:MAG: hypothetical protein M3Z24_08775, partial [Chloroflexota bacterium]|nr:hypothetical protein [Chloroflexota bacterium]